MQADVDLFILIAKGVLAGIAVASPPFGPIALLCVQRSISHGTTSGLTTGFGAAIADGLFALIGAIGLATVVHLLVAYSVYIRIVGALFLLYVGFKTFYRPVIMPNIKILARHNMRALLNDFGSSFFITLVNPFTIVAFLAFFAAMDVSDLKGVYVPYVLGISVAIGSMIWWAVLAYGAGRLRHRLTKRALRIVNRVSGWIIIGLSVFTALSVFVR